MEFCFVKRTFREDEEAWVAIVTGAAGGIGDELDAGYVQD